ncbi:hypothetical protein [Paraclostridium sordellii]|uniref:hypothetical protein n=1 Tax=Paraclostridium sordellii TaxID=1505 RepID=UPI000C793CB2|nr:hypothetical protein [Paeniclostridium sordellii]AUN13289.1 hypothetical protein RSJ16_03275 [Paeniclostridium sordellii]RGX08960.1 hypothetical protein DWV40_07990 [Paeniclostridium sordellii]
MNKLINFLFYILIVNIIVSFLLIVDINSDNGNIEESSILEAISSNDNYNLIVQILKDTHKEDFIKYIDYMQLEIHKTIENDPNNFTAFTITLPQNKCFIAFYKKNKDATYSFDCIVDNLEKVDDFYFYKDFLVIEQNLENKDNYLNHKKFIEIFYKDKFTYESKLKKDLYIELENFESDNKNTLSATMDFLDDIPPKILYVCTTSNSSSDLPKEVSKELYIWDDSLNQFIINKNNNLIK